MFVVRQTLGVLLLPTFSQLAKFYCIVLVMGSYFVFGYPQIPQCRNHSHFPQPCAKTFKGSQSPNFIAQTPNRRRVADVSVVYAIVLFP